MDINDTLRHIDVMNIFMESPFSTIPTAEIERRLGLSHHPTFRKLKILEGNGVLVKQKGGYMLNVQDETVIEIMRFLSSLHKIQGNRTKNAQAKRDR